MRAVILDPLFPFLDRCQRLLLATDGDLTRLPFEVLPTRDGRYLLDDYRISYLSTGRDVLRFREKSDGASQPLVIADPDFDLKGRKQRAKEEATAPRWNQSRDVNPENMHFARLPGTQLEGECISKMLGVKPQLGKKALESLIKSSHSPSVLHLATHGFFLQDQRRTLQKGIGLQIGAEQNGFGPRRFAGPGLENPLLRSGLSLAGANTWLAQGTLPVDAEDGILTAEDVSGLDLTATELVVLSACETGLGEVHVGEGVFGLRRAFVLAGAKTLVMSLWKVSDLSTAILMERFYENLLTRNLSRDESLREAQFYTRDITIAQMRERWLTPELIELLAGGKKKIASHFQRLARKPDEYRPFSAPYYWGGFICQGVTDQLGQKQEAHI